MEMMDFDRAEIAEITLPRYDELVDHETVSLVSDLLDKSGRVVGRLEVVIRFQNLIEGVLYSGWAQSERAFLVSREGRILACSIADKARQHCSDETVKAALKAMQREPFGTILRPDRSRDEVVGFHKLDEAPWSLVLVAQSKEILAPISHFRLIYSVMVAAFFSIILLLIRLVAGQTASSIRNVSLAAKRVSKGQFDSLPPLKSEDEVGQLFQSFNEMVLQLDERIRLKEAMDLAMQVQQSLLPERPPRVDGLDIAGQCIYCDETGGDYYDFISFSDGDSDRVGIAVGDVAGHGISAALFMTTVRALLRSRISQPGSLSDVMGDVNRLLCRDTSRTGDFMSLFLALVEPRAGRIRWVRAGHAPALIYDRSTDTFEELRGDGAAIGFDETYSFREYEYTGWNGAKILFLGTDGIWEQENEQGEMFGMDRLRTLIRLHSHESTKEIIRAVTEALSAFRMTRAQEDDVTVVVVKAVPKERGG
jgi:sigma-B regulation protein RsbU (phosphoserine phosphatase)